jgi:hypothetical protein
MQKLRKNLPWIAAALVVGFLLLQLANPARTNPPVVHDLSASGFRPPSDHLTALLHTACYDCHSYETRWPWYAHVMPVSWQVVNDVNKGRKHLNFSDWPADPARAAKKFTSISEQLEYREMPLAKYTLIHRDARLTDADRQALMDWADAQAARLRSTPK